MDLYLIGHNYKYAAEQMLLSLWPDQRPVYPDRAPAGDRAELVLGAGEAVCRLFRQGAAYEGRAAVRPWSGERERARMEQQAVKLSFYRAALASGLPKPLWGALTGVKPGKLMARYLAQGLTEADFARDFDVDPGRAALCGITARTAMEAKASLAPGDVGLYVGIPFCPTRCAYCSFISSDMGTSGALVEPYLAALLTEIGRTGAAVRASGERPVALYLGGGTPTTLTAGQLDTLCTALEKSFDLAALREYTVEAGRPDTITRQKLEVLRAHGAGRVSVNPQTMSDRVLEAIGRRHTARDVENALALVRDVGGFQVNMDLIAGLPGDTEDGFRQTVERVLALGPENVTVHTLAIKNGSYLAQRRAELPEGDVVGRMVDYAGEALRASGYGPYYLYRQKYMSGGLENVGWAKPGTGSLYNLLMMEELCPVLAMGAGGSTKRTGPDGSVRRSINPKYPKEYIERMVENGI